MSKITKESIVEYCENFNPNFCHNFPILSWKKLHDSYERIFNIGTLKFNLKDLARAISPGIDPLRLQRIYEEILKRPFNDREGRRLSANTNLNYFSNFVLSSDKKLFVFMDYPNTKSLYNKTPKIPKKIRRGT